MQQWHRISEAVKWSFWGVGSALASFPMSLPICLLSIVHFMMLTRNILMLLAAFRRMWSLLRPIS